MEVENAPMNRALAWLSLWFATFPLAAFGSEIWPDAASLPLASFPHVASREIAIGRGVVITARFELTEKGNGGLTVPGCGIRVYDAERDGVTFSYYLLTCEWKDTNADGYLDLVVTGTAQVWSEKGDRVDAEKSLSAVFVYSPAKRAFTKVQCSPEIYSWSNHGIATERPTAPEK